MMEDNSHLFLKFQSDDPLKQNMHLIDDDYLLTKDSHKRIPLSCLTIGKSPIEDCESFFSYFPEKHPNEKSSFSFIATTNSVWLQSHEKMPIQIYVNLTNGSLIGPTPVKLSKIDFPIDVMLVNGTRDNFH